MKNSQVLLYFLTLLICSCSTQQFLIENQYLQVKIHPKGAELQSIFDKQSKKEILWYGDSLYWKKRAPIMFPVNVRMKGDQYTYQGKTYPMPKMGIATISDFKKTKKSTKTSIFLTLAADESTKKQYPFDFRLELNYELNGKELVNRFTIQNTGKERMYFALGGHPGFNCPLDNGKTRGDYEYVFPKKMTVERIEVAGNFLQENRIPYLENEDRIALDDARVPNGGMFLKESGVGTIGIAEKGQPPFVTIDLGDFPNVNLWTPPGYPFACIEPMVSHHDIENSPLAIEQKVHLIQLSAGESTTYAFSIIVH